MTTALTVEGTGGTAAGATDGTPTAGTPADSARKESMTDLSQFVSYPKMARWSRDVIVTEKLDGTNAQILIEENGTMRIGSRNRWLTPENDNYGFARWVVENRVELVRVLGPGRHFGEWWGNGIQRGYGAKRKFLSLFNVVRWAHLPWDATDDSLLYRVPVVYAGPNHFSVVDDAMYKLEREGSMAHPGFGKPEGIVWWHTAANIGMKKTFENDEKGKGQ